MHCLALVNDLLTAFLKNVYNVHCMLILMPLYTMLAYLMLFVCIMLIFLPMIFANALSLVIDAVCLFQILFCIIHSAFNLLVCLSLFSYHFFQWKGYVLSG